MERLNVNELARKGSTNELEGELKSNPQRVHEFELWVSFNEHHRSKIFLPLFFLFFRIYANPATLMYPHIIVYTVYTWWSPASFCSLEWPYKHCRDATAVWSVY